MAMTSDPGVVSRPSRRPVIGITTYVTPARWGPWDLPAVLVPRGYVDAVADAGGRAVLIPPFPDAGAEALAGLDGLIFCGGPDLDPRLYGQARSPATAHLAPERDDPELGLMAAALRREVPVLGICRGMQVLNVLRGGTLVQHLPELVGHDGHATAPGRFDPHPVAMAAGSLAGSILGAHGVVHSGHHQGIGAVGAGLVASAWAPDGTVEAVEDPACRFALGVLWHPEQGEDRRLFAALIRAAGRPAAAS